MENPKKKCSCITSASQSRKIDTMSGDFAYYNANVEKVEEEDCVCRAISLGLSLPYRAVEKMLDIVSYYYGCDPLQLCCYHRIMEDIFGFPVRYCYDGETVGEVAEMYPNNKVIIRIDGHLTCSVHGVIYDIWRCNEKKVDCYWII